MKTRFSLNQTSARPSLPHRPYTPRPVPRFSWSVGPIPVLIVLAVLVVFLFQPALCNQFFTAMSNATQGITFSLGTTSHPVHALSLAVNAPPTMDAAHIDAILAQAHSPAAGAGKDMYQLGLQYGMNPAFALAVFHHESGYGTQGIATHTKSIGNIRCAGWASCTEGYRSYSTWKAGMEDFYRLIQVYVSHGLTTPAAILPVYAPAADHNNVPAYVHAVETDMQFWRV